MKLTKLVGPLVRHNDAKKWHQDMFRISCLGRLDHEVYFPDTSNIQYQSHCDAAIEIYIYHNLYIDFLDLFVRNSKERPGLNNLEDNVKCDRQPRSPSWATSILGNWQSGQMVL